MLAGYDQHLRVHRCKPRAAGAAAASCSTLLRVGADQGTGTELRDASKVPELRSRYSVSQQTLSVEATVQPGPPAIGKTFQLGATSCPSFREIGTSDHAPVVATFE